MKWTPYHPLAVKWLKHPLIGRTLRLEKQTHRYWLMMQPAILNLLLEESPKETWDFLDSVGSEILKIALRINKQKIKNSKLHYGSVFDPCEYASMRTIKSLWILGMRLSMRTTPMLSRMHRITDAWLRQIRIGKSIDIESTLCMAVPWMTYGQRKKLAHLCAGPNKLGMVEHTALQKAWLYCMGCEPDDWSVDDYNIAAARTSPLHIGFHYAGPVQCPWINNIEPIHRHWILFRTRQLRGDLMTSVIDDMLFCSQSIRLNVEAIDSWWYWHCLVSTPPHGSVRSMIKGLFLGLVHLQVSWIDINYTRYGPCVDKRVVECIAKKNLVIQALYAEWEPLAKCTLQNDVDERVLVERMWSMYHQGNKVVSEQEFVLDIEGLIL